MRLVFILGILPRSGTNYLSSLLDVHPDCVTAPVIYEDFVLHHSGLLSEFADAMFEHWNDDWEVAKKVGGKRKLEKKLGQAVLSYLKEQSKTLQGQYGNLNDKLLITKTPSVKRVGKFFDFFPESKVIVLVRDGRSVVYSAEKSFESGFEHCARRWAKAARGVAALRRKHKEQCGKYLVVNYEQLYGNNRKSMEEVLDFLGLDKGRFDFDKAENLGVVGSSDLKDSQEDITWEAKEKDEGFAPLRRWESWPVRKRVRFDYLAGEMLESLGYERDDCGGSWLMWLIYNKACDFFYFVRRCWKGFFLRRVFWQVVRGERNR